MILALTALLAALGAAETQERSRGRLRQLGNRLGTSVTPISFMRRRLDAILRERPEVRPWLERAYGSGDWLEDFREFDKEDRWRPSDGLVLDWISRVAEYPDKGTQIFVHAYSSTDILEDEDEVEGWEEDSAFDYLISVSSDRLEDDHYVDVGYDREPIRWDPRLATVESIPLAEGDGPVTWRLAYIQEVVLGVEIAFGVDNRWNLVRFRAPQPLRSWPPRWEEEPGQSRREMEALKNQQEWEPFFAAFAEKYHYDSVGPNGWLVDPPGDWPDHNRLNLSAWSPERMEWLSRVDPMWREHLVCLANAVESHRNTLLAAPEEALETLFWLRTEVQDHVRAHGDAILFDYRGLRMSLQGAASVLLREAVHTALAEQNGVPEALDEDDEVVRVRWPDGGTIVELLTPEALAMEGARMHHCIGREQQGHPAAFRRGETRVFSVRLPNGSPRGTLEVDRSNGALRDVNGPYNGEITPALLRDRLGWFYLWVLGHDQPTRILVGGLTGASVMAGEEGADIVVAPSEDEPE